MSVKCIVGFSYGNMRILLLNSSAILYDFITNYKTMLEMILYLKRNYIE
jgi:hypothetical protein